MIQVFISLMLNFYTIIYNNTWEYIDTYVDENTTTDLIMNVMMLIEVVLHILQQGPSEGALNFETLDQAIKNTSNDINATTKKS
jgi:hypothetical protein